MSKIAKVVFRCVWILALLPTFTKASEGYLAIQGRAGQFTDETRIHQSWGGFIMGGEDHWRLGAGGYSMFERLRVESYRNVEYWYAGPILYYAVNPKSEVATIHIGTLLGAGFANSTSVSKAQFFYTVEPTLLLAYHLADWAGIGVTGSYRFATDFSGDKNLVSEVAHSFNLSGILILGEF